MENSIKLSKVQNPEDLACNDMNDYECENLGGIVIPTNTPIGDDNEIYKALVVGAEEWREPDMKLENLKRLTSDSFDLASASIKNGYTKYYMCFKDYLHRKMDKPAFCNLISIIAFNILNAVNINEETLDEMKQGRLSLTNALIYSGLFLYKSSNDSSTCSVYQPDGFLTVMIPKKLEEELIVSNSRKVSYSIANWLYPTLSGVIMSFDDMKRILLDPKCIVYPLLCNDKGMHDMHSLLHRDTTNNNLIYQDINMSDDVILNQYRL